MFRKFAGLTAVAGLFLTGIASAQGTIANSAHDFTQAGEFNDGGQLCVVCHTPHESITTVTTAPLWNHTLTTKSDFTLYQGVDLQGTIGQPDGISKLCLSCHDGTVGLDAFGGAAGGVLIGAAYPGVGTGILDGDLNSEHPISISYENGTGAGQDPDLKDPAGFTDVALFGGNVECASCHNVHNESGTAALLVVSNAGSAMCFQCHDK